MTYFSSKLNCKYENCNIVLPLIRSYQRGAVGCRSIRPALESMETHRTQKICYTQLQFITVKGYRFKSSQGESMLSNIQEKPGTVFQLSQWYCMNTPISPSNYVRHYMRIVAYQGSSPKSWYPQFYWGSYMWACSTFMTDLSYSDSSPSEQKYSSYIVSINYQIKLMPHGRMLQAYKNRISP